VRVVAAIVLALPAIAAADPRHDADAHARRGVALYNLGKFDEAVVEFEEAYQLFQSDALLFNLAQAHRKLDHCERALRYYTQFLAGDPSPALAAQVRELVPKLEAACHAKDEPPTGTPTPEPVAAPPPAPPVEPERAVAVPIAIAASQLHVAASGTVGGVISGGIASVTGVRIAATVPVGTFELGGAIGAGELWRGMADHNATTAQLAAVIAYRVPMGWARLAISGELGAAYVSLLDSSSGVVPGIGRAGQWAPLARGELGAEHDVAPSLAVRAGLALGFSPRTGDLDASIGEIDLVLGLVYAR
jgi:tetratricopeptide (TPR) repeat protein